MSFSVADDPNFAALMARTPEDGERAVVSKQKPEQIERDHGHESSEPQTPQIDEPEQIDDVPEVEQIDDQDDEPKPDTDAAVAFAVTLPGCPQLSFNQIDPNTGKKGIFETRAFPDRNPEQIAQWI